MSASKDHKVESGDYVVQPAEPQGHQEEQARAALSFYGARGDTFLGKAVETINNLNYGQAWVKLCIIVMVSLKQGESRKWVSICDVAQPLCIMLAKVLYPAV